MKKRLLGILCLAIGMVTSVAGATDESSLLASANFDERALQGQRPHWGLSDSGEEGTQGTYYWYETASYGSISLISGYASTTEGYRGFSPETNPQPGYMKSGETNVNYLAAQTTFTLQRSFKPVRQSGETPESIALPLEGDLFVDALVRFEPRRAAPSEVPTVDVDYRAKFLCWLSAPEGASETNFIVTAGYFASDGSIVRANYVATNRVVAGTWYRLTARAIRNAATAPGDAGAVAFALFLDGVPIACTAESYVLGDDDAAQEARFRGNTFHDARALFPSLLANEVNPTLRGLAMQGRLGLDEIGVTSANPFGRTAEEIETIVALVPSEVTNVFCEVFSASGGDTPRFTTNSTGVARLRFKVQPGDRIRVTPLVSGGYLLGDALTPAGNKSVVDKLAAYEVTLVSESPFASEEPLVLRIETKRASFRVGDQAFVSLDDAIAAAAAAQVPLALNGDVTLDPETENGQMRVPAKSELSFDLCGHTLTGEHFQDEATIYDQGRLVIYDSVGGGAIVAPGTAIEVISENDALEANHAYASLTLGDERYQTASTFTVKGRVRRTKGELSLRGGRYLTPFDVSAETFYLGEYVAADRFKVSPEKVVEEGENCTYYTVEYDGRYRVAFTSARGTVTPAYTNVAENERLERPTVTEFGCVATNWYDVATSHKWDFASDRVTSNMTLRAEVEVVSYAIAYDPGMAEKDSPHSYTVESVWQKLGKPTKANFTFAGWRDQTTGRMVDAVGQGATYVDARETLVSGDLNLVAEWTSNTLLWQNTDVVNVESNGTYAGAWSMNLFAHTKLQKGTRVTVDEIAFGLVNPLLYPKTAPCLLVTPKDGAPVRSAVRTIPYDEEKSEYVLNSADFLKNGRARVAYPFTGLSVVVGETNEVRFCSAEGATPTTGFLRLVYTPSGDDGVFGNCTEAGGTPSTSEAYKNYCPLYEVRAHVEEGGSD